MPQVAAARLTATDAHAAGGVVRLVTGGFPAPRGRTIEDKAKWLARRHDGLCSALTHEPRGHDGIVLAVLCDPVTSGADAGVLFRHGAAFLSHCGHGLIGVATIAIERRLIVPRDPGRLSLDTDGGLVSLEFDTLETGDRTRVVRVRYVSSPSFVFAGGVALKVGRRVLPADIAFGGSEFLVILDSEGAGVPLARPHLADLRRAARVILEAAEASIPVVHPVEATIDAVGGVVFTGPPEGSNAQLRCAAIYADGTADRSASGAAVSAVVAVLDAMGLAAAAPMAIESLAGTSMSGRVVEHLTVGDVNGVRVELEASAWIVADHEFFLEPDDPLVHGVAW
jgi:proline racemase/trans-L-3-hydroxyproline dehydratase